MDYIEKAAGLADNGEEAYRLAYLAGLALGGVKPGRMAKAAEDKGKGKSLKLPGGRLLGGVSGILRGAGKGVMGVGSDAVKEIVGGLSESAGKTPYDLKGMELDALRAEYLREAARLRRAARVAAMPAAAGNSVRMRL